MLLMVVTIAVYAAYSPSSVNQFVYDDQVYIVENVHVSTGLSPANIVWAFTHFHRSNWHPVSWISHMIDVSLFGLAPGGHHLTSILLHIVNSLVLFLVLVTMTAEFWRSALAAMLFALHPLNVESVAWIAERKNLLSMFFMLMTILAYYRYVRGHSRYWYIASIAAFAFGLMSKPSIVCLPFLLLLLDYWPLRRLWVSRSQANGTKPPNSRPVSILLEKLPFFVLTLFSCITTLLSQESGRALVPLTALGIDERFASASLSYVKYISKAFFPRDLAAFYPAHDLTQWGHPLCALLSIAMLTIAAFALAKKLPWFAVGWLWFCGAAAPVIGLVQVGQQSMADRYMYAPGVGLAIIAAWASGHIARRLRTSRATWLICAVWTVLLAVLGLSTYRQTQYWKNDTTLFVHADSVTKNNFSACLNAGCGLMETGHHRDALTYFRKAIRIDPTSSAGYNNAASVLYRLGNRNEAMTYINLGLRISPLDTKALALRALFWSQLGDYDRALADLDMILRQNPNDVEALYNSGVALARQSRIDEAIRYFAKAITVCPEHAPARNARAALTAQRDKEP
jgi:tetratricopeptide (TPR) repeat protein